MKQILPILTLTTLTAAAFADAGAAAPAAPASGLSYNTISLTYVRSTPNSGSSSKDYVLQATALIGNSNFLVVGNSNVGGDAGNGSDTVGLGYVFKNLVAGADATILVRSNETYGVRARKEIGSGFEASLDYTRLKQGNSTHTNVWGAGIGYNVSKDISIDLSYSKFTSLGHQWGLGLRKNF
jgi:opacity protein-like surface antigen